MSSISIVKWSRKRSDRPRFYITDGREALGVIYETRGVFTSINERGRLVLASTSLQNAVNSLMTRPSS